MAKAKKIPTATVLDRRLLHPFGSPSIAITLKEGEWEIRIVDSQMRPGRIHDMRHNKGWEFVTAAELDGTPDEYGLRVVEDRLVRGENGREVLMKMRKDIYNAIQQRKSEINAKAVTGPALKEAAAQETAVKFGSEAGDRIYSQPLTVTNERGGDLSLETDS